MPRCADCGFLCIRANDGEFVEVNADYRQQNTSYENPQAGAVSMCFVMAYDLREEFDQEFAKNRKVGPCVEVVLRRERPCERFTPWHQGFTPKEHREMLFDLERKKLDLLEKEADRRWTERREKGDRSFQVCLALGGLIVGALLSVAVAWLMPAKETAKSTTPPPVTAPQPQPPMPPMPSADR